MKNILITGGSGMIGKKLTPYLEKNGYAVAWLSRKPKKNKQTSFGWDVKKNVLDEKALTWCDGIIHLAGAGISDKRWTDDRKKEIRESRTASARLLYEHIRGLDKKPEAVISASGINYYGFDTGSLLVDEENPPGNDFLADTVVKWEAETLNFQSLGIRTAIIRTGIVLDKKNGALAQMMAPPVAAPLGSGNQYMSWIHWADLVSMYHFILSKGISGVFNGVAPYPVVNKSLIKLAAEKKGKVFLPIPVPPFALKLAVGEMSKLVTGGIKASSEKIQESGFMFKFPYIEDALSDIYRK